MQGYPILFGDAAKFSSTSVEQSAQTRASVGTESPLSAIDIKSTPDGAEITVDEKFMGNTPSTLRLAAGDHKVKLEKSGFSPWEKTLTMSSGESATVNASLQAQPNP